jgi:hypothetical protein
MAPAGYSGTPLAKKLGLKPGQYVWFPCMPATVRAEIGETGVVQLKTPARNMDVVHFFTSDRRFLEDMLADLRKPERLARDGMVWVSWPKKASKVPTDITEDVIREVALPMGWVDVKVCAVDETWSGLKLMIRKALR